MDALHSLRARSDSFDSVGSFAVLSTGDLRERRRSTDTRDVSSGASSDSGEYDDDEWEVLSEDAEDNNGGGDDAGDACAMRSDLVIHERHFEHTGEARSGVKEPECEPGSKLIAASRTFEPECAVIAPLSPLSKSLSAREVRTNASTAC